VAGFFKGKNILLTGGTGFLGKVVLERLLWEDMGTRLRLLLRGDAGRRIRELALSQIFARCRSRAGLSDSGDDAFVNWFASHVDVCTCDLEAEDLGLSSEGRRAAFVGVDIVLHCAARVSWDERIDAAIRANTLGSRALLNAVADIALSSGREDMPVFLHVSSTFVHGMLPAPHAEVALPTCSIQQVLDPDSAPPFDRDSIVDAALADGRRVDREVASSMTAGAFHDAALSRLPDGADPANVHELEVRMGERRARTELSELGIKLARSHGWWDPYTFSKALAEMYLTADAKARGIPFIIVRPSGISSCALQPVPGWIDAYLLNEPIIEATGKGQLSAFPGREESILDMVPADFVTELMLVAASRAPKASASPEIYQVSSGIVNPVFQGDLARWWFEYFKKQPFLDKTGKALTPVQPKLIGSLPDFLSRMRWRAQVPLQTAAAIMGVLPSSLPGVRQAKTTVGKTKAAVDNAMRLATLYSVYTLEKFRFQTSRSLALLDGLPEGDCQRWHKADCRDINWRPYFDDLHIPGMRTYVLKELHVAPKALENTRALSRRQVPLCKL